MKRHSTSHTCTQVVCTPPLYIPTPTTLSTLQIHRHPPCTIPYISIHTTLSYYSYLFICFLHRLKYNLLEEPSAVDPTLLHPAEQLQWSISSESAKDIDIAKKNLDRCVHVLALFQDSQHQESLGMRLCVCTV